MENDLPRMKEVSENKPKQLEYAIGLCKVALDRMRKLVIQEGFPDLKSEIHFFKKIKPRLTLSCCIFRLFSTLKANVS
jgi:hypothetical protein